jgi:hypothetical protein
MKFGPTTILNLHPHLLKVALCSDGKIIFAELNTINQIIVKFLIDRPPFHPNPGLVESLCIQGKLVYNNSDSVRTL